MIDAQNQVLHDLAMEYTQMGNQSMGMGELANEDEVPYGGKKPKLDDIAIRSAMANYSKAIRIWPGCIDAMIGKARLLVTIDELAPAEETLKAVLERHPDNYEAHMGLGELYGAMKDTGAAIKSYKRAIKARRTAPQPHEALASIYGAIGLDDLAEEQDDLAKKLHKAAKKAKKPRKKKS